MIDFVRLQEDVAGLLRSSFPLRCVNVVQYRKLRVASESAMDAVWQTPRNGRAGAGLIVEMPTATVTSPNVSGPALDLVLPVVAVEEPNLNFTAPMGTLLSAEEIVQWVFDLLHQQHLAGIGTLQAVRIAQAKEYEGVIAYRAELKVICARNQTARCAGPVIAVAVGAATLTTATANAEIFYTLDGSCPSREGNPSAQLYAAPVPVVSGDVLRVGVFKENLNPSEIRRQVIA